MAPSLTVTKKLASVSHAAMARALRYINKKSTGLARPDMIRIQPPWAAGSMLPLRRDGGQLGSPHTEPLDCFAPFAMTDHPDAALLAFFPEALEPFRRAGALI